MRHDVINGFACLMSVIVALLASQGIYHLFQLESYQFPGFFRAIRRNRRQAWTPGLWAAVASFLLIAFFGQFAYGLQSTAAKILIPIVFLLLSAACGIGIARVMKTESPKKPFVFTNRVKRLYVISAIVLCGISYLISVLFNWIVAALWPLLLPLFVAVCGVVAWGPERLIYEVYFRVARRKLLAHENLIRIGITGSYGKTTVKHILGTLLSEKYPVLITPKSFNTPMGVVKTIRERLQPSHRVFVAEMGARHIGDIKELCRLVKPSVGILTSVGPQHLETFKTVERVTETKYDLIAALPEDGQSFFFDDHAICRQLYERTQKPKTLVSLEQRDADVWSENIRVSAEGSTFDLCFADGESISCNTRLLGEHNIINILMAAAVADKLGLSKNQIRNGIRRIEPIESRMELRKNPNSYTIINDGFNANPVGAQAALDVLKQFPKRRIIVTPGMVELGTREAELNNAFGKAIAEAADIAIIVGKKRVQPILDGLREADFPKANTHQVGSFNEAVALLNRLATKEDTVLFENDLPDNYQEN